MGTSTSLQLSLVLFAGLAAATLVPSVRRSVPRWVDAVVWLGLMASGWLTVTHVQGASARFLTDSVTWGLGQVVKVSTEIVLADVEAWLTEHRFGIANTFVVLALLDVFLLAALESHRQGKKSSPRVMLGEWFEFTALRPAIASTLALRAWDERSLAAERVKGLTGAGRLLTWFARATSRGFYGVTIRLKGPQGQPIARGRPVDIRSLATAESLGPLGQASALVYPLGDNEATDGATRLAS